MPQTREAAQGGRGEARIIEERRIPDPHGEERIEAVDDRGRRWHHFRPASKGCGRRPKKGVPAAQF